MDIKKLFTKQILKKVSYVQISELFSKMRLNPFFPFTIENNCKNLATWFLDWSEVTSRVEDLEGVGHGFAGAPLEGEDLLDGGIFFLLYTPDWNRTTVHGQTFNGT